jgi:hypothetical protein
MPIIEDTIGSGILDTAGTQIEDTGPTGYTEHLELSSEIVQTLNLLSKIELEGDV